MIEFYINLNPILQALIACIFTFSITALGAGLVIFFKNINKNILDAMLGSAAGVMIAASFWSLLSPAISLAETLKMNIILVIETSFISGGLLLFVGDKIFSNLKIKNKDNNLKKIIMLVSSITLHNIPEGLAIGVAFGTIAYGLDGATLTSACLLAFGIGIQNFPEGTAVSVPLRKYGLSRKKSFIFGSLSGIVEPIAGVIGAILALKIRVLLPFLLAFAAGAMIYVVVVELIPESQSNERKDLMAMFTLIGFTIMMMLDVMLG